MEFLIKYIRKGDAAVTTMKGLDFFLENRCRKFHEEREGGRRTQCSYVLTFNAYYAYVTYLELFLKSGGFNNWSALQRGDGTVRCSSWCKSYNKVGVSTNLPTFFKDRTVTVFFHLLIILRDILGTFLRGIQA
jgi:hypothetical protein